MTIESMNQKEDKMHEDFKIFETFFSDFVKYLEERLNNILTNVNDKAQFYRFFTARLFLDLVMNDYNQMKIFNVENLPDFDLFLADFFNSINKLKNEMFTIAESSQKVSNIH